MEIQLAKCVFKFLIFGVWPGSGWRILLGQMWAGSFVSVSTVGVYCADWTWECILSPKKGLFVLEGKGFVGIDYRLWIFWLVCDIAYQIVLVRPSVSVCLDGCCECFIFLDFLGRLRACRRGSIFVWGFLSEIVSTGDWNCPFCGAKVIFFLGGMRRPGIDFCLESDLLRRSLLLRTGIFLSACRRKKLV